MLISTVIPIPKGRNVNVAFSSVDDVTLNMVQLILELMAVRPGAFKFSNN